MPRLKSLKTLAIACLAWAAAPVAALAACGGTDLLPALAREQPEAHAGILDRAASIVNGEGRFWRVERQGTPPSHIFGTFHAAEAVATVPDAAWAALDGARLAVFEIHPDEEKSLETRIAGDPQLVFDASAPPLSTRLDPETLATVHAQLAMRGVPAAAAEQMRPFLLFSLLALPPCEMQAQMRGERALDSVMSGRAADRGIPQRGLETVDDILAVFDGIGSERLLAMLAVDRDALAIEEDIFRTNHALYAAGRIGAVAAFNEWLGRRYSPPGSVAAAEAAMTVLIEGRNATWLPALEAALAEGGAFVAVGALHLPGDGGLVELLRARGWTVTRLE